MYSSKKMACLKMYVFWRALDLGTLAYFLCHLNWLSNDYFVSIWFLLYKGKPAAAGLEKCPWKLQQQKSPLHVPLKLPFGAQSETEFHFL